MKTADFDYELPEEFIAQGPVEPRDSARLMVIDTVNDRITHRRFSDLREILSSDDVLVLNRSKVIGARLLFDFAGKEREIFLLRKLEDGLYRVLVRPGKAFKMGVRMEIDKGLAFEVVDVLDDGSRILKFDGSDESVEEGLDRIGVVPLPPYIKHSTATFDDYQTVYAKERGSVAAPTAGLHFTEELLSDLQDAGINIFEVILHVGRGTFLPVTSDDIADHVMHSERFIFDNAMADGLNMALDKGRNIVAVGTTSVRVLESVHDNGALVPQKSETDIFIYPGKYKWNVVDKLITNFHLPKSTLLMLVASFLENKGYEDPVKKTLEIYEIAKAEKYRFYSFGDAMIIL